MRADEEALEKILGHCFRDRDLLRRALTHKSRAAEQLAEGAAPESNEQLEFLGDSILGFVVSDALMRRYPSYPEGRLSKLKAQLVSASHLYQVAVAINLGDFLLLGRGEEMSGGRSKRALLADAVEALIAALFLDGGLEAAGTFISSAIIGNLEGDLESADSSVKDFKSALQEAAQALKLPQPRYCTIREQGPEHAKVFTVEVRVGHQYSSQAEGFSKKTAGQRAAELILRQLAELGAG